MVAGSEGIYLDYSASTPMRPSVLKKMSEVLAETGNASSVHAYGRHQRQHVEEARAAIAKNLHVKPAQVVFTSGATEANNMAMKGLPVAALAVSSIEHPSILQSAMGARQIKVTAHGVVDIADLENFLKSSTVSAATSVMLVNNETGVIQPLEEISKLAKQHGALLHCDAVQAWGKIPFTFESVGADVISLSAHKIGGPQGVGALIVREGLQLNAFMQGGGQEMRRRAGTENVAAIAGFGEAVTEIDDDLVQVQEWESWRDQFEETLLVRVPQATIFGHEAKRVPTISCIAMPGVGSETQLMAFDLEKVAVSSGSACSSGKVQASHVLKAMGVDDKTASSAIRVSFGWNSTSRELEKFGTLWLELYRQKAVNNTEEKGAAA
jgi:cysteine desulfurase